MNENIARKKLLTHERKLHVLVDNAPDMILRYDRRCRLSYANAQLEVALGIPLQDVLGKTPKETVSDGSNDIYEAALKRVISSGKDGESYLTVQDSYGDETYHHMRMTPELDDSGKVINVFVIGRDITERRRMEEALRVKEEEFRSLAENLPDNIVRWDVAGRILYSNPVNQRDLGKSAIELIGKTTDEVFPDGRFTRISAAIALVVATGQKVQLVRQSVPKGNGEMEFHDISLTPERDGDGKIISVLGIGRDLTEFYRLQDELHTRELQLRALADSSPGMMGAFYARPDGSVCMPYVSPNIEIIFGLHPEDVAGDATPLMARNHPDDAQRVRDSIAESARAMTTWHEEFRILHPTRGERWIESNTQPQLHPDGGVIWYGYLHDITERKLGEIELHQREQEFRSLVENAPNSIARYDTQCRRIYANPRAQALFGLPLKEILGKTPQEHSFIQSSEFMQAIQEVIQSGQKRDVEFPFNTPQGEACWGHARLVPEFDISGALVSVLSIGNNLTERKRMERELREQKDFQQILLNALKEVGVEMMVIENGRIGYVLNRKSFYEAGYTDAEIDAGILLSELIHPDERAAVMDRYGRRLAGEVVTTSFEIGLVSRSGERREFETFVAIMPDTNPVRVITIGKDITERKRAEKLEQFRTHTLELLSSSASLPAILEGIVLGVEQLNSAMLCSILLLDSQGKHLVNGVAPSLPDFYNAAIDGVEIGMGVGSCGTAAFTGKRVIGEDLKTHPYWAPFKELTAKAGLGSCWSQPILSSSGQVLGTFGIYHRDARSPSEFDLSLIEKTAHLASIAIERKQAEERLVLSERRQSQYFALAPGLFATVLKRADGSYAMPFVSEGVRELYGLEPEAVMSDMMQFAALAHPDDIAMTFRKADESARDLTPYSVEYRINHPTKGMRWIECNSSPQRLPDGGTRWDGFYHDITERKIAQSKMEQLERAINLSSDAIFLIDEQQRFNYVNSSACRSLGYSLEELLCMTPLDIDPDVTLEQIQQGLANTPAGSTVTFETRHRTKDGYIFPVELHATIFEDSGEKFTISMARNITERKRLEEELRLKELLIDHAHEAIYLVDRDSFVYVNEASCRSLGYSRDELLALTLKDIDPLFSLESAETQAVMEKLFAEKGSFKHETRHYRRDGSNFPVEIHTSLLEYQGRWVGLSIVRDITERKRLEQTLAEREQHFRSLAENSLDVIVRYDRELRRTYVNPAWGLANGVAVEEVLGKRPTEVAVIVSDSAREFEDKLRKVLESGEPEEMEISGQDHLGNMKYFSMRVVPEHSEHGEVVSLLTMANDITERKRLEDHLAKRERDFRSLAENLPDNIARWDAAGRYLYLNPTHEHTLGRLSSEIIGTVISDLHSQVKAAIAQVVATGQQVQIEQQVIVDGVTETHFVSLAPEFDADGQVVSVLGIGRDLTQLASSQKMLDDAQKLAQLGSWNWDVVANRVEWSEMAFEIYTPDKRPHEPGFEDFKSSLHADDMERVLAAVQAAFEHDTPFDLDHRVVSVSKGVRTVHAQGKVFRDTKGKPVRMVGTVQDITERKRMEEAIVAREQEFRSLAESSPDVVIRVDCDLRIRYLNAFMVKVLELGSAEEVIGRRSIEIWPDGRFNEIDALRERVVMSGKMESIELVVPTVGGKMTCHHIVSVPERDATGHIIGTITFGRDISAIRDTEHRLNSLVENLPGVAYTLSLSPQGVLSFPYVSAGVEEMYGITPEAAMNDFTAMHGLVHPDDKPGMEAALAESARALSPFRVEARICPPGQPERWLDVRSEPQAQPDGSILWFGLIFDISERKRMEDVLRFIAQGEWLHRDEDFLTALASYLGKMLGLDYVIVDKLTRDPTYAETVAIYAKGAFVPNMQYSLQHTPCENVMNGGLCCYPANVQQQFPRDILLVDMQVESYVGMPLWDSKGKVIGLLALMDGKPMSDTNLLTSMLQLVATSAAAALEQQQADAGLKEKFEQIVELNNQLEINARDLEDHAAEYEAQAVELEASRDQVMQTEAWYRNIVRSAPDGMVVVNESGLISLVNLNIEKMFGYEEGELIGHPVEILLPAEVRKGHVAKRDGFFASAAMGRPMDVIITALRACRKDGSEFPVYVSLSRLPDMDGRSGVICAAIRDVTEHKRLEDALAAREHEFRTLCENSPDVIMRYDRECRRVYVNPVCIKYLGKTEAEVLGKTPAQYPPSPYAAAYENMLRHVLETGQPAEYEYIWPPQNETKAISQFNIVPEFGADGKVAGVMAIGRDITERKRMEEALIAREHESRTLIDNSPDNISRYNRECRRTFVNQAFAAAVEGGAAALLGKTPAKFPGGPNAEQYEAKIREAFETARDFEFELRWPDKVGREICSHVRITPERDAAGNVVSVLTVGRDITELNEHRKRVHQMAFYDSLTSLPNRALFHDRLHQMITDASWHQQLAGVMLLDLDRFKAVNDTLGHPAGDELLCEAAARLTYCVRGYDTVARLGGDEFAILLPEIRSGDDLGRVANKIIAAFNQPFLLEGKEVFVTASVGIAVYPLDSEDSDDLLKHADSAMYFSKRSGRNTFRFYSKDLSSLSNERLLLEGDLRRGFGRGELELYYQPKVSLSDGMLIGSEALLRWNHPQRGMVPPDKFISIAEDSGLIIDIGEWVLRDACRVACEWNNQGKPLHKVAINLSARQFQSHDLVSSVRRALDDNRCSPEWIELEITESLLLDEGGEVLEVLEVFRKMGITIAIDDFGTGYSSLNYLAKFPIDTLKIDRSFISKVTEGGHHPELVKAIISIAHSLKQKVVAEGVETVEQAAILQTYGCHIAQGYLYSKPISKTAFEALPRSFGLEEVE